MKKKEYRLRESDTSTPLIREKPRIDEAKGIVYDVKVLGKKSRNGKEYTESAINDAIKLCEGIVSYQDHETKEEENLGGRLTSKRFGRLRGMYKQNGEAYCKQYQFNPAHPYAKQFIWQIKNDPQGLGLSINGGGTGYSKGNGTEIIEHITYSKSVDIVDGPGTNTSLFEQDRSIKVGKETKLKEQDETVDATGTPVTMEDTTDHNTHLVEAIKALADSVKDGNVDVEDVKTRINAILDLISGDTDSESEPSEVVEQLRTFDNKLMNRVADIIDKEIIIKEQLNTRIESAKKAGLKDIHITEQFKKQLLNATSDEEIKEVITDRCSILNIKKQPIALPPKKAKIKVTEQERKKTLDDSEETSDVERLPEDKIKELAKSVFSDDI